MDVEGWLRWHRGLLGRSGRAAGLPAGSGGWDAQPGWGSPSQAGPRGWVGPRSAEAAEAGVRSAMAEPVPRSVCPVVRGAAGASSDGQCCGAAIPGSGEARAKEERCTEQALGVRLSLCE